MASWQNSIVIRAPVNQVFAYLDDPMGLPEWMPGMVEVHNVIGTGTGQQYEWSYKMAGMLMHGQTTVVEHVPNKCAVHQTIGAIHATWGFSLEPDQDGTLLTSEAEYHIPIPVIGKLAEHIVLRLNEREFELSLLNVKDLVEP